MTAEAGGAQEAAAWVRAARSAELSRGTLLRRVTRDGQTFPVLLWRTRRGTAVAIDARCPHRAFLMAGARIVRDTVECPLHGYRFGADGRCVNFRHAPAARVVEVVEADGYLWLAL
ncbi:MAG TPA: Rieske (2Fe-2S) protein [Actinoplanes sp.]